MMKKEHFLDQLLRVRDRWQDEVTDFMPLEATAELLPLLQGYDLNWRIWGGWEDAERVRIAMSRLDMDIPDDAFQMTLLRGHGRFDYVSVSHRDYLGAMMSLGFTRDKLGDILIRADGCDVFIDRDMGSYLMQQELRVKRTPLRFEEIDLTMWRPPERRMKEIRAHLNSLRIDAIMAQGFGISRAAAVKAIETGLVQLDHRPVNSAHTSVQPNQMISAKGFGRLKVGDLAGKTKKGKWQIFLFRYL